MKKMKMAIKDAVEYSQNPDNDVAIHVPTKELYDNHEHNSDEIIELIDEEPELTIVIKSDGKKVVTAECNGIKVQASCNDSDVFSNVEGSHLAINRLFNALDKKAKESTIEKGDIVEVVKAIHCSPEEAIGIQGIVTSTDVYEVEGIIEVNFPVAICGSYCWSYSEEELKLIRKG